ncbi:hypothetical protein [Streptomyces sp. NPDC023588]|uniref:hypothetical protein n=1 Tax=Streptomyces sp. NPDC023588 TaxID=3154907 RepID=UPI0034094698
MTHPAPFPCEELHEVHLDHCPKGSGADFNALEEAADELLAREAQAVLAEGGPTVSMAELLADLFSERGEGAA